MNVFVCVCVCVCVRGTFVSSLSYLLLSNIRGIDFLSEYLSIVIFTSLCLLQDIKEMVNFIQSFYLLFWRNG